MAKTNKAMIYNADDGLRTVEWSGDSLRFLQGAVDGYIELLRISDFPNGIDAWINEDGKFRGDLAPSSVLLYNNEIYDYTVGNIVFTRVNKQGKTVSLKDDDISTITKIVADATYDEMGMLIPHFHY